MYVVEDSSLALKGTLIRSFDHGVRWCLACVKEPEAQRRFGLSLFSKTNPSASSISCSLPLPIYVQDGFLISELKQEVVTPQDEESVRVANGLNKYM